MKFLYLACLLMVLSACSDERASTQAVENTTTTGSSNTLLPYPPQIHDLENGLRVITVKTDSPDIVSLQINVHTGSRNEIEEGKSGFAHFFEHMMFRGSKHYTSKQFMETLARIGADTNAYTTDDYTNYHTTFTRPDLETVIRLEADRFQRLQYDKMVFRTEALAVKGEYLKNFSNPSQKINEAMRDAAYATHPYKHTTMGYFKDINDMPEQYDYSKLFYERWYKPENTIITVVGDIEPATVNSLVAKYWGEWQPGKNSISIAEEKEQQKAVFSHIQWKAPTQSWIAIGFHGPKFTTANNDAAAISLLLDLHFSDKSSFYKRFVEDERIIDKLVYQLPLREDPTLFTVSVRLIDNSKSAYIYNELSREIAKARSTKPDTDQLNDLKSAKRYSILTSLTDAEKIAATLTTFVHFNRSPDSFDRYIEQLSSVSADDIYRNAQQYLKDGNKTVITLANSETLPIDRELGLEKFSTAENLPADGTYKMLTMPSTAPLIDFNLVFMTGAAHEPDGKKGLTALMAAMLLEADTSELSINEVRKKMLPMGASFDYQLDKEMLSFHGTVHSDHLDNWYSIIRQQLFNPGWKEKDLERIRQNLVNYIKTDLRANNDEELGKEVLYQFIYGKNHPYGTLNQGNISDIQTISLDDLKQYYKSQLTQSRLVLGIAGNIPEKFIARVKSDLNHLPKGEKADLQVSAAPDFSSYNAQIINKETPATAVSFGFPISINRSHDDWVTLWLLRSMIGEHRSFNGILYNSIRESRGMNYGDYAYIEYFPRGMFQFHPDNNLARQQQIFQVWIRPLPTAGEAVFATRVALHEINKLLEEGVSQSRFEDTRQYLMKFVSVLNKSQQRRLGYQIDSLYYGIPEFRQYVQNKLQSLTLDEVNRVARQYLQTDKLRFVFVTRQAEELKQLLVSHAATPMKYNSPKPKNILEQDRLIEALPMKFTGDSVTITDINDVFDTPAQKK